MAWPTQNQSAAPFYRQRADALSVMTTAVRDAADKRYWTDLAETFRRAADSLAPPAASEAQSVFKLR